MNTSRPLTKDLLKKSLTPWANKLKSEVLLIACGGTALTLKDLTMSTKDADFIVPLSNQYNALVKVLRDLGYECVSGNGWKALEDPWIYDLFAGNSAFTTGLLDPLQDPENHEVIFKIGKLTVACLKPNDLIITKLFRGTQTDVDDSCLVFFRFELDLATLFKRYKETASYDINERKCKTHFQYFLTDLQAKGVDTSAIELELKKWTP